MKPHFDAATLRAYKRNAGRYSRAWIEQPTPSDMYALFKTYLVPGGTTADVGCGNGRDVGWLAAHEYRVTGFDAAQELLDEARRLHQSLQFRVAVLPTLKEITETFDNVVCGAVIMHLPVAAIEIAIASLLRILKPGGILYLSWRVTQGADNRQPDGRLYSSFEPSIIMDTLATHEILMFDDVISERSGKPICRVIVRKTNTRQN